MDDMQVPENIDVVAPAVHPVSGKINTYKRNKVSKPGSFDMIDSNLLHQPGVSNDADAESQYIFGNIGDAATEAADHVHITDSIFVFSPTPPFFK